jgi:P4 family phage/plasmid primase-like protien
MTSFGNGLPVSQTGGQVDSLGGTIITSQTSTDFGKPFSNMAAWAMDYARGGWRIFPLHNPTTDGCSCGDPECSKIAKHPRIGDWQHAASSNPETVAGWWDKFPSANIALSLDGLCCLDVDPRHGGERSLLALEEQYARLGRVAMQRSGSDGAHFLFKPAERHAPIRRGFRPGLDWLVGNGCYIVCAPSLHSCGGRYEWEREPHPLSIDRGSIVLPLPPAWLLDAVSDTKTNEPSRNSRKLYSLPAEISEGGRNCALTSTAGKLRRTGLGPDEMLAALRQINVERCKPPLDDREVESIARSIGRKEPAPMDSDAGLTKELASAILATDSFARDKGTLLYHWEGGVYRPNGQRVVERRVKELCEAWERTKAWSPELATRVCQWLLVDARELWERPPADILNCRNGLLDIGTRTLGPHSPEYLSTVQIAATFDPVATCPQVDKFIRDVFPEDSRHLAYEIAGWLMVPDTSIQKSVLLLGEGANGKSVWLSLLETFLGKENVSTLSLHRIEADKFAAARLVGKLCNIGTDLPTATLAGTSMFKALVGGDTITAERKFETSFEFRPFVRLLFSANTAPRSEDATHGFFRRWLVIPFNRTFDESDPDTVPRAVLDARLSEPGELSGMLNRALDALPKIREGRFTESATTRAALDEFRRTTDPLAVWLDQNTVEHHEAMIVKDELRTAYAKVCQDMGRPIMPVTQFTAALRRLRPKVEPAQRRINGRPTHVFIGLGFMAQDPGSDQGEF